MNMVAITIKEWLEANGRTRTLPADQWYLAFARKLLPFIGQSPLFKPESERIQAKAAVSIGLYFRDAISQSGGWSTFTGLYHARYGTYLPFYTLTEEYAPDEINQEDVAFVLWTQKSHVSRNEEDTPRFFNPHDPALLDLSQALYEVMDRCFEEAPICNGTSPRHWVMEPALLETPATPLPEVIPGMTLKKDVERCLAYSNGKPLLYFADYRQLHTFFTETLEWETQDITLLHDLKDDTAFVIYANAKGMLIAPGVAACFCEGHNPLYNAERAATEGYELFCRPGKCPFDLLKYGMAKGILPDIRLPFPQGKEVLHQHWDFISRYYLREYYEGK